MTELGRASLFALSGVALVLGMSAGCSDSTNLPQATLGGAGGSTSSGGTPISGSSSSGSPSGGTPNGGSGVTAGSGGSTSGSGGTGGSGGAAGSGGTAGSGGSGGMMTGCTILPVTQPMIYEFPPSNDTGAGGEGGAGGAGPAPTPIPGFSFGYNNNPPTVFSGYSFLYPATLESDVSEGNWHVSGTVGTYAGFQLGFVCGANASDYLGISFKISGDAGPSGTLSFVAPHAADVWKNPTDTTTAAKCMAPAQYDGTCVEAAATVEVSAAETTVSLLWADFENGKPEMNPNPAELMALRWLFDWDAVKETDPTANAYEVNVRLDDLTFIAP